ncbi:MAG: hypothetical protein DRP56_08330 [Planctomycetota bacterium]|nr:MAG: hypothetical protein DRP56_08330 [Planctomycetota bacterium]
MKTNGKTKRRGGLSPDKYLSEPQIGRLLLYLERRAAAGGRRAAVNRFIVIMLLYCGLRAEELLSLRLRNLPGYHGKNAIEVERGKGGVARAVQVPDWLTEYIAAFVKSCRKGAKPGGILIPSERGYRRVVVKRARVVNGRRIHGQRTERSCRMTYHSLWAKVRRIGLAAGIGKLHPHMFRHTYLSRLYNVKQDLRFVQDQAGHLDPKTTAIYTRTNVDERTRQVQDLPRPFAS